MNRLEAITSQKTVVALSILSIALVSSLVVSPNRDRSAGPYHATKDRLRCRIPVAAEALTPEDRVRLGVDAMGGTAFVPPSTVTNTVIVADMLGLPHNLGQKYQRALCGGHGDWYLIP